MASSCRVFLYGILYADLTCFICLLMLVLPIADSLYFQVPRFDSDAKDVVYVGDAEPSFGAVDFNSVVYCCRVGQVLYKEKVPLWDSNSGKLTDFVTRFSFVIDTQGFVPYGHGLAFFLAPVGFTSPLNSAAGFLGLFNTTTSDSSSQGPMISVEFDSFSNREWDPPVEHVGINKNSLSSLNYVPWNASLHSKDTTNAWVSYNATTKNLSVFWTYERNPNFQGNSSLSYQIDLKDVLPSWVTIGISASTGQFMERHILQYWEFRSSLDIKEKSEEAPEKVKLAVGLAVPLGVLLAGAMVAYAIWLRSHRRSTGETLDTVNLSSNTINDDLERGAGPKRFPYRDLALATNNFSDDLKLGEGGFGCVYRGYLTREQKVVAVKKISRGSKQGKKEYITEVKIISSLRHRNLVQLIGWCHEKNEFLLVYEFMPNGSLDSHLFGKMDPLAWPVRYKISLGLASALLYLHEEWEQCVVHRDIKSSNVMLDSGFNVKLGDFGLARLMDHELGPQTTGLAGTLGYMAPEYVRTGKASKESDVYSFGVVAIEICCGRKARDCVDGNSEIGLVDWVWHLHGRGEILLGVDERLKGDFDAEQAKCLMMVGLWCAHPDRSLRPSIRQAIQVLNFEAHVPNLSMNMPVVSYHASATPTSSSGDPFLTSSSINIGR
ncbi:L-type lectin-domain containing receptor kinase IX.1-like [Cynara cardunculus var. scolymus]|uniref:L-type lectin-domain containing receptor kinase IX.1-like n=1 Tax=Cynara cardunculus var. scolymus TaxID=59895 RepID=UPI000D629829|nr:L-type lectin-domain containing receptor kinase IX.1-like [Cynara cardunculus var. scolymus]